MLTPDEVAFKRRQLASLREAHPDPAPHVADAIARLEAEAAEAAAIGPQEDQLAAAHAIIAGLEHQLAEARQRIAGHDAEIDRISRERDAALAAAKPKTTKRKADP